MKRVRKKIKTTYPMYSLSLSFSSTNSSKYLKYLLEKFRDDFQNPPKGFHLIRGITHKIHFLPIYSLQTKHVYRTNTQKLQKMHISLIHFSPFKTFLSFM